MSMSRATVFSKPNAVYLPKLLICGDCKSYFQNLTCRGGAIMRQFLANTPSHTLLAGLLILSSCLGVAQGQNSGNPPAPGFNLAGSDARAMAIADEAMQKLGGRQNWDDTHYLKWRFFGRRLHVWDKWTGDIRVEHRDQIILMNLNTHKGRAWKAGVEVTHPDSLAPLLQFGYEAWINDSYWVFMPYKLKDSGV